MAHNDSLSASALGDFMFKKYFFREICADIFVNFKKIS